MNKSRTEYGDWQTNYDLAKRVCDLLKEKGVNPTTLIEPTCGEGSFILAALDTFDTITNVYAIDIYKPYLDIVADELQKYPGINVHIFHENIFSFDFSSIDTDGEMLIIGNPPWVTNSRLGELASDNLPRKSNFKNNKGLEAITGKGNFDIAEYISLLLLNAFSKIDGHMAVLLKNSVIKNIVQDQHTNKFPISGISQYEFNAPKEFGASTSASLFFAKLNSPVESTCSIYDLYTRDERKKMGVINGKIVADVDMYDRFKNIDGRSSLVWRSGLKHDCSKIMELTKCNDHYKKGLSEDVSLESDFVYPLIKSSDIKDETITSFRKHVIVTQKSTNDDTSQIALSAPRTYQYLEMHSDKLDGRKSTIYKNRPCFCIFGIGDYSFMPYKVIISALYDNTEFSFVGMLDGKPVVLDDTCYMLGFERKDYALITQSILNSTTVQGLIKSLSFPDAKRLINKDLLMRIDLFKAATDIGYRKLGITKKSYMEYLSWLEPQTLSD